MNHQSRIQEKIDERTNAVGSFFIAIRITFLMLKKIPDCSKTKTYKKLPVLMYEYKMDTTTE